MDVTRTIGVIEDPRFQNHVAPDGHPEAPARLVAVSKALANWEEHSPQSLSRLAPRHASDDEILRVHTGDHLRHVSMSVSHAPTQLDPDTYVSAQSLDVARLAAGSCIDLAMAVASGELQTGFAALRPPGHHAEAAKAMGFCLFNNVAIAARALQQQAGIEKVLILDWDVHHGNGTQHSFERDPSILYMSTHQFPYYPGTGAASETGIDMGFGTTVNIPMPPGCGNYEYVGVMQHLFAPIALEFAPDIILVSCGFDAHAVDPLGQMEITQAGFLAMTQIAREVSEMACNGRIAYFLEGGYAAQGLIEGTQAVLAGTLATAPDSLLASPLDIAAGSNLHDVVRTVSEVQEHVFTSITAR
ncbi:MAG: acetoin utilization deacetylase AcuC-like enzyme [Myxococcota bacterium]|jgi:acetoin utilization deacetylase AcuC-like enzyme